MTQRIQSFAPHWGNYIVVDTASLMITGHNLYKDGKEVIIKTWTAKDKEDFKRLKALVIKDNNSKKKTVMTFLKPYSSSDPQGGNHLFHGRWFNNAGEMQLA